MNPVSDERFMELAMKLIGFECTAEEKAELHRIIEQHPERREQLQKLCISAGISRELLPLANALEATEGEMTAGEKDAFKLAVAKRREQKKTSTKKPGDGAKNITPEPPPPRVQKDKATDAQPVGSEATQPEDPKPLPFNKYLIVFTVVLGIALFAWLVSLLFRSGSGYSDDGLFSGGLRWRFAIVQPMLGRNAKDVARLRETLASMFSGCAIEEMPRGSQRLKDWESTRSRHMVHVECILESGPIDRLRWLIDSFEVQGWRGEGVEFKRSFDVNQADWTNSLFEIKAFVDAQK